MEFLISGTEGVAQQLLRPSHPDRYPYFLQNTEQSKVRTMLATLNGCEYAPNPVRLIQPASLFGSFLLVDQGFDPQRG